MNLICPRSLGFRGEGPDSNSAVSDSQNLCSLHHVAREHFVTVVEQRAYSGTARLLTRLWLQTPISSHRTYLTSCRVP